MTEKRILKAWENRNAKLGYELEEGVTLYSAEALLKDTSLDLTIEDINDLSYLGYDENGYYLVIRNGFSITDFIDVFDVSSILTYYGLI